MSDREVSGSDSDEELIPIQKWSRAMEDIRRVVEDSNTKDVENETNEEQSEQEPRNNTDTAEPLGTWHRIETDIRYQREFTENRTRQVLVYSIITIFVIWIILSLFYFMFTTKADMLTTGGSVIAGPFGAVLGYYLAKGDQKEK